MISPQLIVFFVVAVIGFVSGYGIAIKQKNTELGEVRAAYDRERAGAIANTAKWEAQQRIEEGRRIKTIMEVTDAANLQAAQARADAQRLDRVAGVLRNAVVAAYASKPADPSGDPATAGSSTPATDPGLVLPDLFGWADSRLRELASVYDQARIAGILCERSYGALISGH